MLCGKNLAFGPGQKELEEYAEKLKQELVACLRQKGISEARLNTIIAVCFASGFLGIKSIIGCLIAAGITIKMIMDCYKIATAKLGGPPYDENNGHVTREQPGHTVTVGWNWVNRLWPIDNEIHWVIEIHNKTDGDNNLITSFKVCFKDNVDDLFDQTEIPKKISIKCDGKVMDSSLWRMRKEGKCLIFEVESGFENIAGLKKCCTITLEMDVEADGTTTLGSMAITVDLGKDHHWGDGTWAPGPVLASTLEQENEERLLAAKSRPITNVKPEFANLSERELLRKSPAIFEGISDEQASELEKTLKIATVEDVVLFMNSDLFKAAKRILRKVTIDDLRLKTKISGGMSEELDSQAETNKKQ